MYTDEDIDSAIKAGALSEEAAEAFRAHVASLRQAPSVDEEHFRLISGFNDIFVVIACVLLLVSVSWIGAVWTTGLGAVLAAGSAWLLAEFFTRKRRMALPSIVLLLAFVGNVYAAGFLILGEPGLAVASAIAAVAAWLHWVRFRVPITVAAGACVVIGGIVVLLLKGMPEAKNFLTSIFFISGMFVFYLAMRWDAGDRLRQTRKSDVAFWLHLVAAPLLVHPVFSALHIFDGQTSWVQAVVVIGLYIVIALISLAVDRRALMVSALAYVIYTFSALLKAYGVVNLGFAITALAIGSALLLLSAYWHPCRKYVLGWFPAGIQARLATLR